MFEKRNRDKSHVPCSFSAGRYHRGSFGGETRAGRVQETRTVHHPRRRDVLGPREPRRRKRGVRPGFSAEITKVRGASQARSVQEESRN